MENLETKTEKAVYKLSVSCGRQGDLNGVFIAEKSHVKKLIEAKIQVYFGEVLGKHSEIYGAIEEDEIIFVSDNPEVIKVIEENVLESGYNPFEYTAINFEHEGIEDGEWVISDLVTKLIELQSA